MLPSSAHPGMRLARILERGDPCPNETLAARVENLERRLELLEALPARVSAVELQIVQLRTEMREQFSAIRQEFAAADSGLREEFARVRTDLRAESARAGNSTSYARR